MGSGHGFKDHLATFQEDYLTWNQIRRVLKCTITLLVASLFSLIVPVAEALGPANYLVTVIVCLTNLNVSIGSVVEANLFTTLGACFGAAAAALSLVTAVGSPVALEFWLLLFAFIFSYIRARYPRTVTGTIIAQLLLVLGILVGGRSATWSPAPVTSALYPTFIGVGICLLSSLVLWPEPATKALRVEIVSGLRNVEKLLKLGYQHLHGEMPKEQLAEQAALRAAVAGNLARVAAFRQSSKMEFDYGFFSDQDYSQIVRSAKRLFQQATILAELRVETVVMANPLIQEELLEQLRPTMDAIEKEVGITIEHICDFLVSDHPKRCEGPWGYFDVLLATFNAVQRRGMLAILSRVGGHAEAIANTRTASAAQKFADELSDRLQRGRGDAVRQPRPRDEPAELPRDSGNHRLDSVVVREDRDEDRRAVLRATLVEDSVGDSADDSDTTTPASPKKAEPDSGFFNKVLYVYFLIFSYVELINELGRLVVIVRRIRLKRRLHFPRHRIQKSDKAYDSYAAKDTKQNRAPFVWWRVAPYQVGKLFATDEVKFALKASVLMVIVSSFNFYSDTAFFFANWHGEWCVVTIIICLTANVGGSIYAGLYRVIGTVAGALWAIVSWYAFPSNPYGLAFMTVLFALPSFYFRENTHRVRLGFTMMITYSVILFGAYTTERVPGTDPIYAIAYKRATMVALGVVLSLLVTVLVWPVLARQRLRLGLANTIRMVGHLFKQQASLYVRRQRTEADFSAIASAESRVQLALLNLRASVTFTATEPRVKGPFPRDSYVDLIELCQFALERLMCRRLAMQHGFGESFYENVIVPLFEIRQQMLSSVLLSVYILEASLVSKSPIPAHPPEDNHLHDSFLRLQTKLLRQTETAEQLDVDFVHWYSWALASRELVMTLRRMMDIVGQLFGKDNLFVLDSKEQ